MALGDVEEGIVRIGDGEDQRITLGVDQSRLEGIVHEVAGLAEVQVFIAELQLGRLRRHGEG